MEQFEIIAGAVIRYPKPTGIVSMFRPSGEQASANGYDGGGAVDGPWGVNIDGNGGVWVGNIKGRSVALLAGDGTKSHPDGVKTGDLLHAFPGAAFSHYRRGGRPGRRRLGGEQLEFHRRRHR
jgi:hypothetical protein